MAALKDKIWWRLSSTPVKGKTRRDLYRDFPRVDQYRMDAAIHQLIESGDIIEQRIGTELVFSRTPRGMSARSARKKTFKEQFSASKDPQSSLELIAPKERP